jgi:hypothetical protein
VFRLRGASATLAGKTWDEEEVPGRVAGGQPEWLALNRIT